MPSDCGIQTPPSLPPSADFGNKRVVPIVEVELHKASLSQAIGLTLEGDHGPPRVKEVSGLVQLTKRVHVGQCLLEVNGEVIEGHLQATALIKAAHGRLLLKLSDDRRQLL